MSNETKQSEPSIEFDSKLQTLEAENAKLSQALIEVKQTNADFDGIDIEQAKAALAFKAEAERKQLEAQGEYQQALNIETQKFNEAIKQEQAKNKLLNLELEQILMDSILNTAITQAGGTLRPLRALIQTEDLVRLVSEGDKRIARVFAKGSDIPRTQNDSMEPMSVDDLITELQEDIETAGLFAVSGRSGGGMQTSAVPVSPNTASTAYRDFEGNLTDFYKSKIKQP